ncbi:MAG: hypothetical protein A2Y17_05525 [Clostridiales bacterium GWF2_38_85]|nr:MAG: hypothetical protein A2Y17_05525 [Clostridiales bacterium GWF2_38_85]HBL83314.1 hypothetical protein [Clostridiales bacterium]
MLNDEQQNLLSILIILSVVLVFIIIVTKNKYILDRFERLAEKILSKSISKNKGSRIDRILNLNSNFSIYEVVVDNDSPMCKKTLRENRLRDNFIQVLKIDRGSEIIDFPTADTIILHGDRLIVYGKIKSISKLVMKQEEKK